MHTTHMHVNYVYLLSKYILFTQYHNLHIIRKFILTHLSYKTLTHNLFHLKYYKINVSVRQYSQKSWRKNIITDPQIKIYPFLFIHSFVTHHLTWPSGEDNISAKYCQLVEGCLT